jgi:hypothetical protein
MHVPHLPTLHLIPRLSCTSTLLTVTLLTTLLTSWPMAMPNMVVPASRDRSKQQAIDEAMDLELWNSAQLGKL